MFSSLNFNYKNNIQNSKQYLIMKQQQIKNDLSKTNKESLNSALNFLEKKDSTKIQRVNQTILESKELDNLNTEINITKIYDITKLSKINKNILNVDELNITYDNTDTSEINMLPFNINELIQKGIKIINNVYQSKYKSNMNSTGLGDFIRGSYFILDFCDRYNFEPKIIFNNYISKLLKIKTHDIKELDNVFNNITFFSNTNYIEYNIKDDIILDPNKDNKYIMRDIVDYMKNLPLYNGNIFIYCISHPIKNEISEKNKQYMKNILEPIDEIKYIIYKTLKSLNLVNNQYSVIHIRSGDSYLNNDNKKFKLSYITKLVNNIHTYMTKNRIKNGNNYLLIADNNEVKNLLKTYFPFIKILINEITHFGEGIILNEEKVKNTLVDFYLMSFSNNIMSFSCYEHGSGFSYWCAKTYNIPYVCKLIK